MASGAETMSAADGAYREAERRIASWREGENLDLSIPNLEQIPTAIEALTSLQILESSLTQVSDLSALAALTSLQRLSCSYTQVSDLSPLTALTSLQSLNCFDTNVSDLNPLAALTSLRSLDCTDTQVSDLSPLAALTSLQRLSCSYTQVSDLRPLKRLISLQSLDCSYTQVSDLRPLAALISLQSLDCSNAPVSDLRPLSALTSLQSIDCRSTQVSDLSPLMALTSLRSLDCTDTQVSDLRPLAALTSLQRLSCSYTQVSDLRPLKRLISLQSLDCSNAPVSDLRPLSALTSLQSIDCRSTQVSDLSPLMALTSLQSLDCYYAKVSDLSPLAALTSLQSLDCSFTKVSDLSPLAALPSLQSLYCIVTPVSDLSPLAALTSLQDLNCGSTRVRDLNPLKALTSLQSLDCGSTQVSDLSPLATISLLKSLDCSFTQVSDLSPLATLSSLQSLNCSKCHIESVPEGFWFRDALTQLTMHGGSLPGVPPEVLSKDYFEDCLESLRAHLRDLGNNPEPMSDAKLLVLGNGRAGKTQICRRLRNEEYDAKVPSTHGVIVSSAPLPAKDGAGSERLNIWDFGGQDIYHGTHALFLKSRALFLVVWSRDMETTDTHTHDGMVFRNFPLPYWLRYVQRFGSETSPVLVVQAKCDTPEMDVPTLTAEASESLAGLKYKRVIQYSAREDRGRAALNEALSEACRQLNQPLIGLGRAAVKRTLEDWRDADATKAVAERLHRTIKYDDYLALCAEKGGISDPDLFLTFLHDSGTVFYRPGLFDDQIILDQSWALEAIYAVFSRETCYPILQQQGGRFTLSLMGRLMWDTEPFPYSVKEQALFITMMETCGICFQHRPADKGAGIEAEYVAPDLLPVAPPDVVEQIWEEDAPTERRVLRFSLLPSTLIRSIISRIGARAGLCGDYWRHGLHVYERDTRSRALIEQKMEGDWQGSIVLRTQKGRPRDLLDSLSQLVLEEAQRFGLKATVEKDETAGAPSVSKAAEGPSKAEAAIFVQEPCGVPECYVSYAWNDDRSTEGRKREELVDRLCLESEAKCGVRIHRDKDDMQFGDSISKFMDRIGAAERVFVFLSDKYLKSPFCMYELYEIWRTSRQNEDEFAGRIRTFLLDDADIWSIPCRLRYAAYWGSQWEEIDKAVREHGAKYLSEKDARSYRKMSQFAHAVGDILAVIADRVQPRDFSEFEQYGFRAPDA